MAIKKDAEKKKETDPKDVINTATSAASGVPKPIIDAATKPKPPVKPKPPQEPERPEDKNSEDTVDIGKKKKKN